jgi:hypothetical protein
LFVIFTDICPILPDVVGGLMGQPTMATLLNCPEPAPPLFELMPDVNINFSEMIDTAVSAAQDQVDMFEVPADLAATFENFGANYSLTDEVNSDNLLFQHREVFGNVTAAYPATDPKIVNMTGLIQGKEWLLENVRGAMTGLLAFGQDIMIKTNETRESANAILAQFGEDLNANITEFIQRELTCRSISAFYATVRDPLCYDLVVGMAYWLITALVAIVALAGLEFSLCMRRQHMMSPRAIEGEDDDDLGDF